MRHLRAISRAARPAFTIVEILVVVTIIVILIAILVPALGHIQRQAVKTTAVGRLRAIGIGMQQYYSDFNTYPPSNGTLGSISQNHGYQLLAEALLGYLPGNVDGAGTTLGDSGDFGFRMTKAGATMGGRIYGPYAPNDAKTFNGNSFIDPWGHEILYYRSTRFGPPNPALPAVTQVFGSGAGNNYYFSTDDNSALANPLSPAAPASFYAQLGVTSGPANNATGMVTGAASYILISAGPDEKYFTADDIVVSK